MAWTYEDYITLDNPSVARLTRLRLHVQEVSETIAREVQADGKGVSSNNVTQYRKDLMAELEALEKRVQLLGLAGGGGRVSQVRFRRP